MRLLFRPAWLLALVVASVAAAAVYWQIRAEYFRHFDVLVPVSAELQQETVDWALLAERILTEPTVRHLQVVNRINGSILYQSGPVPLSSSYYLQWPLPSGESSGEASGRAAGQLQLQLAVLPYRPTTLDWLRILAAFLAGALLVPLLTLIRSSWHRWRLEARGRRLDQARSAPGTQLITQRHAANDKPADVPLQTERSLLPELEQLIQQHQEGALLLLCVTASKPSQLQESVVERQLAQFCSQFSDAVHFARSAEQPWQPAPAWREYALIIPGLLPAKLGETGRMLLQQLAAELKTSPCDWHLGLSAWPPHVQAESLLAEAEMAQSQARGRGRRKAWQFEAGQLPRNWCANRATWQQRLKLALRQQRFLLLIQPGVRSDNLDIHHHELLLRLRCPGGQLLPAWIFLPMARELGLLLDIDRLVLTRAFRLLEFEQGSHELCSLNLSEQSLLDHAFQQWLLERLRQSRRLARRLILEIPEQVLCHEAEHLTEFLQALHQTGCRLLADQVGQCAVDCSYLKQLPLDFVKVDRFIIHDIHQRREHQLYVRSLAELARRRDLILLAMGVECAEEWQVLAGLGIRAGQGRYISEPLERVAPC